MALAAGQRPIQTRSALLPVLGASLTGAGASNDTRIGAGGLNNPAIFSRLGTGVTASQLLFDFGRTRRLIDAAELQAAAADDAVRMWRSQVLLDVTRAYYSGLRADAVVRVARQTLEARRLVLDQVRALAEARLKSGLDVSFAEVSVAEAELLLQTAYSDRKAADVALAAAMGEDQSRTYRLVEETEPAGELEDTEALLREALMSRPELIASRRRAEADAMLAKAESRLKFPTVSVIGSAGYMPVHVGGIVQSTYAAAGLNLGLPVLNGGNFRARQAETEFAARATSQGVRQLEIEVSRELRLAVLNATVAAERAGLAQKLVAQTARALELARSRYDLGLSSIVEVSQTQLANTQAEIGLVNAQYDIELQRAVLAFQAGRLH
jgi:outer membrane protein